MLRYELAREIDQRREARSEFADLIADRHAVRRDFGRHGNQLTYRVDAVGTAEPHNTREPPLDAFRGQKLEGTVASVAPATGSRFALMPPDNASGNFVKVVQRVPVRIDWKGPPGLPLAAGLSAEVKVHTAD